MKFSLLATIFFSFLILPVTGFSSSSENYTQNTITVQAQGEVNITADLILFSVNITQFSPDAKEAFQEHKRQEAFITQLLLGEGVAERDITANPINISASRRSNNIVGYETRQQVQIKLQDVNQFESMQLALIENGFTNFSGSFSSTKITEAFEQALIKAVDEAKAKAEILATAAGLRITGVQNIEYGSSSGYSPGLRGAAMTLEMDSGGSLLQFEHSIPVRETVRIIYYTAPE